MVEERSGGEGLAAHDASQTRQNQRDHKRPRNNEKAGEQTKHTKWEQELQEMKGHVKSAMERGREWLGKEPKWKAIEANLDPVLKFIQTLAQQKSKGGVEGEQGHQEKTLSRILDRLDRMEKNMARDPPSQAEKGTTTKPLWSEVATGGKTKAVVEVRMAEMEGAKEETPEEKLQRIKTAIPDARAIIPHPRARGKISVVVPSTSRRDQILAAGIKDQEGIKIIRRPKLVMVMGVPIHTPITVGESEENNEWARKMSIQNAVKIERVTWLYKKEKLEKLRKEGTQKKGSIIVEVATEADQTRLTREGVYHGPLWLPAKLWDVSMKATQCFRCWKWGHTQSVCNAEKDICGHCAKQHSTRDCNTKELKDT